jgi:hypothetical protein
VLEFKEPVDDELEQAWQQQYAELIAMQVPVTGLIAFTPRVMQKPPVTAGVSLRGSDTTRRGSEIPVRPRLRVGLC